ncbi:vitamin B12 dependent-methionine synthase activation domain-containing protein [Candidatus Neomarinimicrobiota bacterium]
MKRLIQFDITSVTPEQSAVLSHQGLPEGTLPGIAIKQLLNAAYTEFERLCRPVGITEEVAAADFPRIFNGEDQNHHDSPINQIYPQARQLTLFVITMGTEVSDRIAELFKVNDYALGAMLDSVASMAADQAASVIENRVADQYCTQADAALAYSPGYCGWHISGQKRLFQHLNPAEIGITLNSSYLMSPVKSVSGVVISGPSKIHKFVPKFNFCKECRTKSCVERIAELQLD